MSKLIKYFPFQTTEKYLLSPSYIQCVSDQAIVVSFGLLASGESVSM